MTEFFTGGLNLNQQKIIEYNNRPFKDTDEMNEALIQNINQKVKAGDKLYIVGNFLFGSLDDEKALKTAYYFRKKINCNNIFLTFGNHDRRMKKEERFLKLFSHATDYMEIKTACGTSLILFHYPMFTWNRQKAGAIHVYAAQPWNTGINNSVNVGVDNYKEFLKEVNVSGSINATKNAAAEYQPFSVDEVKRFAAQRFDPYK